MNESPLQAAVISQDPVSIRTITQRVWFTFLPADQQQLIELSFSLFEREKSLHSSLVDCSFIIFPMAKAYEGFLKLYLLEMGLISQKTFEGRRFRIGRALNPDIRESQRDEFWLYDNVAGLCGHDVARMMWDTWLECRNQVFHYFPNRNQYISLPRVEEYLFMMDKSISQAYQCKLLTIPVQGKSISAVNNI
jgi:hypothetical protein